MAGQFPSQIKGAGFAFPPVDTLWGRYPISLNACSWDHCKVSLVSQTTTSPLRRKCPLNDYKVTVNGRRL